jgi:mono/diheme cytochrome c family protein
MRLLAAVVSLAAVPGLAAADVDFARDVLPILSDNCFHCHGPDAGQRKAGLRLDTKDGAFRKKAGRTIVVPGDSADSELVRRVSSTDADEVMPPPDSNRKLTPQQVETLRKWVDEGAKWGQHWAFVPLPKEIPNPKPRIPNPIDGFILARLEKEGLTPAPEASQEAWLRRVTLDLTGLPPTLAEIDAFLKDDSPAAYQRVVDRLLASPRYGERMAADWLDVARYADTHGYQMDRARPMWAYRDWVIRAFNRNQPFDRFLTEQLAGDLLLSPTKEQRLATAFNRLHMQNEEGGVVEEEFRVAYVVDRVTTMGTAFLGMTFECARCHDHKFDPFTMRDFYSLFAFFQNIDESGQTTYFTDAMPVPTLLLTTDDQDRKLAELARTIAAKEAAAKAGRMKARPAFEAWLRRRGEVPEPPGLVAAYSFDDWKDDTVANSADPKKPGKPHDGPKPAPGTLGQGAELNGDNGFTFPGVGHFTRTDPFTLSLWVNAPDRAPRAVVVHHSKAPIDAGSRGYELLLEEGRVAFGLHHMWPGNSLKVVTRRAVPVNAWAHVAVTYDGSSRAAGVAVYIDGEPAELEVVRDGLRKDITYDGGEPDLAIGYRFRDSGFKGGRVDEFRVFGRALTPLEAAHLAGRDGFSAAWMTAADALTAEQREGLFEYFLAVVHEPAVKAAADLRAARREHSKYLNPIPEAMVMEELPTPKPAFVLRRGAYDAPGERVTADTPKALPPFPPDQPRNRLGLARWLTQPDHPLTARVTVNRLWQQMFGRGLVETSDNFGTTGTPPTHPELLDWLARDFVAHGWDVKRFLKQVALSETYRRSSRATPEMLRKVPYNHLLARFPARRLTAEMLRDQALYVGGLLVEKQGGPSVYPYQPEGLWDEAMGRPKYPRSKGEDLYRRSLYTVWKRTAPHPQLTTFDAADRSVCTVQRQATNTPLQALALLNDPQIVEAARFLGQRMLKEGGDTPAARAAWAFRTVTGRPPTEREAAILVKLHDEQKAEFAANPKDAEKLLAVGDSEPDPKLDKVELAAAATLALAVLNHDEAVNRR